MRSLRAAWKKTGNVASGAAWVFVLGSLFGLAWVIASLVRDPSDPAVIISTEVGGRVYTGWGLTYRGHFGAVIAAVQALGVAAAAVASSLPAARGTRPRRIGHAVLCAWAALWAFNFIRVASLDHLLLTRSLAVVLCLFAACTAYRAFSGWWPRRAEPDEAAA